MSGMGWGVGTPQQTTSLGVPLQNNGMNSQIDQPSAVAQQMWADYLRQQAAAPPQQPYDYSAGTSFGGAATGSPVLPPPPPPPAAAPAAPATGYGTTSPGANPYLSGMADDITRRTNQARDQALTSIQGNFVGQNALGSGRHGLAQGQAIAGSADNLSGNLANLFGSDWTNQQNRNLTNDAQRNSFYLNNRQLDQSGARLGADLYTSGMSGEYDPLRNASGIYAPYTGYGTTTNNTSSGGGWLGAAGGLLNGATLAAQNKWW